MSNCCLRTCISIESVCEQLKHVWKHNGVHINVDWHIFVRGNLRCVWTPVYCMILPADTTKCTISIRCHHLDLNKTITGSPCVICGELKGMSKVHPSESFTYYFLRNLDGQLFVCKVTIPRRYVGRVGYWCCNDVILFPTT